MSDTDPLYVTHPFLPPFEEFVPYLREIWDSGILTNQGPLHQQFEDALSRYLGVPYLSLFTNGTLALVCALQGLRVTGEVITTPYSFPATSHALSWNRIKPVFVDIDPVTLNLDPGKIERAITRETTAILPVHCYGNPCDVDSIREIADGYNLKVIYDAAPAFGVQHGQESILNHGDMSILSFHATKVFTTFEGGALACKDDKTKAHIDNLKNFGFLNDTTVVAAGINAKMSEFGAALGLLQLRYVDDALERRRKIDASYRELLRGIPGIRCIDGTGRATANCAYFPIRVEDEYPLSRDELYGYLRDHNVFARRYFYPLISDMPMYRDLPSAKAENLPVARRTASRIICLPIYPDLTDQDVGRVTRLLEAAG